MPRISVHTLGRVAIQMERRSIGPSAGRPFALLLYLASRRGQWTPRRVLQELFFPRTAEARAGHSLRQLVYRLRQLGVSVQTDSDGVQIAASDVWIDWIDILERGELGTPDMELVAQGLFPAYAPEVSEGYREWFEAERSVIRLRLCRAIGLQLTQLRRAGRWDLVDSAARALLALDPLNEDGNLARAGALAASGSKTAALRVIDDYLEDLGDDQPNLKLTAAALRRRISERLPEMGHRPQDERIFVGREDAMRMLSAAGAAARAGTQQTVLVWGEPGIGKTRLLEEYKALACLQGALAFQCTCQPHDVFRPLGILSDLVGQLLQAPGALGCDPEGRELLMRLVTAPANEPHSSHPRGESSLPLIMRALDDLFSAIACESPVLVLLDDTQWLDRTSLKAIVGAFSTRVNRRTTLVIACRDRALLTNSDGLADSVLSIRVNPLKDDAALELARSLLGGTNRSEVTAVEEQILGEGRGNPFFIRLLCRHISSTKESVCLDDTIARVLERRLEQLSSVATRTLEAAVVLGKNCTYARLATVLEMTRLELLGAIEELDDRGLVEIRDGCYVSCHALLSTAVADRMSISVARALHAAAAELLNTEFDPSEGGSLPWDCAEHWRCADDHIKAIAVLRSCAERSLGAGRPSDALSTYEHALTLKAPDAIRYEVLLDALRSVGPGIDWKEALTLVPQLKQLRERLGRGDAVHDEFEIIEFAAMFHSGLDPRSNVQRLRVCLESPESTHHHRLAAARQLLMISELTLNQPLAEHTFSATADILVGTAQQTLASMMYHTCFGDLEKAKELAQNLIRLSTTARPSHLSCLLNAGYAQYRLGVSNTKETLLHGLELASKAGARTGELHACLFLATLAWSYQRFEECRCWLQRFDTLRRGMKDTDVTWEYYLIAARLAIVEGRLPEASVYLDDAWRSPQATLDLPMLLIRSCQVDLRLASGEDACTDPELRSLLQLHLRARGIGRQDEPTLSVLQSLEQRGKATDALALLLEYLKGYRRDGFPVSPELLALRQRLVNLTAPK